MTTRSFARVPRHSLWTRADQRERQPFVNPLESLSASHERVMLVVAAAEARNALREAASAAAEAADRARSVAAVLDEALAVLDGAIDRPALAPLRRDVAPALSALSPREREVLALVAEGRTNKAIAEALYVSPNTVKTHVASLLSKLQAGSRAQLAALAARQPECC